MALFTINLNNKFPRRISHFSCTKNSLDKRLTKSRNHKNVSAFMEAEVLHRYKPSFRCTKSLISPYLMVYLLSKTIKSMILRNVPQSVAKMIQLVFESRAHQNNCTTAELEIKEITH